MRATGNSLFFKIVVRRMTRGNAPFGWEVIGGDAPVPLHVSADRFSTMEAAYSAGQVKLTDLLTPPKTSARR